MKEKMLRRKRSRGRGFTLIELMVVILIIAILAALIVPRIIGRTDDAKISKAKADISSLSQMISSFRLDTGRYPTNDEGLNALESAPSDVSGWKGPYSQKAIPVDPWNNEYHYESPGPNGEDFVVISYGADGQPGGDGNNADITGD